MLNKIILMGRLTRDPELRRTESGTAVCSFSIAVDRDFKSKNGEKETDFIDIVSWRATAEFVSKYFTKGRMAVVEGRLQIRDWTDKEGGKRRSAEVIADNVYFGDSKPKDGGEEDDIPAYLGRFREIFAQGKRNGYAYGRGEKYALELGNDLSRALTSELAMLAVPETLPLFLRKYQHRQIKQYRRREPVYKGAGDIICCLDESGSTAGDLAAWGKAVAMTLLEIAQSEGRKFALVHFSGPGRFQTDVFLPGQSSLEEKLHAAETFLGGGTDFQTPLAEAERLMREGGFENADIAFITDGECSLPETCVEMLQKAQSELRFTVTGILLDEGNAGMDFSLKTFCQNIYRTSELTGDQIVEEIVLDRV